MQENSFIQLINSGKIIIPEEIVKKWQEIVDILSDILKVPAALIMRINPPYIEVFKANISKDNPFKEKQVYKLAGLYCEKVIKTKKNLLVPNALKDKKWDHNPDLEFGMISYLGFPIICPDKSVFGTICLSDTIENCYDKKIETLMKQYKNIIESHLSLIYQNYLVNESLNTLKKKKYELQTEVKEYESDLIFYADRELMIYRLQNEVDGLRVKIGLKPKYYYTLKEDSGN
jgi:transcriptional regulator with GAF, ATPase, and Fis domain